MDCKDIKKNLADDFDNADKTEVVLHEASRDHMCVYLRVRPLLDEEKNRGEDQVHTQI